MHRILTFTLCVALGGCAAVQGAVGAAQTPSLTFERAELVDVSAEGATVKLFYQLGNPYPVALPISDAAYRIDVEGHPLVNGQMPNGLRVAPEGKAELVLPAHFVFSSLGPALGPVMAKGSAHYRVQGQLTVDSPVGPVAVTLSGEGELNLGRAASTGGLPPLGALRGP